MITKNHNGHNFQFTKFLFIDFVLTDRSLSGKQPKSASGKSSSCWFSFSAERNANTKVTEYVTLGFFFDIGFLPLLEKFVLESTVDGIFRSFVPLIQTLQIYSNDSDPVAIKKNSLEQCIYFMKSCQFWAISAEPFRKEKYLLLS